MNETEQILVKIRETLIKEMGIYVQAEHIKETLFWSGLSAEKRIRVEASLQLLADDSAKHAELLKELESIYKAKAG